MDLGRKESFGSKFQSATFRLFVAVAVAVPGILVGTKIAHLVSEYREATWYTQLAEWYGREAEKSQREASKYLSLADRAEAPEQADTWRKKAEELSKLGKEQEEKSRHAKLMKKQLASIWG